MILQFLQSINKYFSLLKETPFNIFIQKYNEIIIFDKNN